VTPPGPPTLGPAAPPGWAELELTADVVTGEAVALDLRPASFAIRALALALDLVVIFAVLIGWGFLVSALLVSTDAAAGSAIELVSQVAILFGIPIAVETMTRGRSLGKLAAGIRVVRDDGGPIRFRHALIRGLMLLLDIYLTFGSAALICSLSNRRGKRLGDLLAGTYVIRDRGHGVMTPGAVMPPSLRAWAGGVDLGRVPDPLAAAARQFLTRAPGLHPASRQRLGVALADQLARHVAPPPPPGTLPETFIAAVMAERRVRDLDRLQRAQAARADRARRRAQASPLSALGTRLVGESDPDPRP
jgi:uncharacterized RDD family membrane protein YckC